MTSDAAGPGATPAPASAGSAAPVQPAGPPGAGSAGGGDPAVGPTGAPSRVAADVTWERLNEQLDWYDRKASDAQRRYKLLKTIELIVAAAVPVIAALDAPAGLTAGVAAIVVVLEGVQQLFQWQALWVRYRSTAEALKHERYLYLVEAGPYRGSDRARALAERIEGLISQEHAGWVQAQFRKGDDDAKED